jgi:hypothetical protein
MGFLSASAGLLGAGILIGITAERHLAALRWLSAMVVVAAVVAPLLELGGF